MGIDARPTTPTTARWYARLLSLVVLLVVAVSVMVLFGGPPPANESVPAEQPTAEHSGEWIDVDPSIVQGFQDHASRIDFEAYYGLLDIARRQNPDLVRQRAPTNIRYAQLLDEPDRFRGGPISLRGRLRRLTPFESNDERFERVWEGWVYTDEAGTLPYAVILADPPVGIGEGERLHVPVQVDGFFLGWWRYSNQKGNRTSAPLIMASRVQRLSEPAPVRTDGPGTLSLVAAGVLLAGLVGGFWWMSRQSTPARSSNDDVVFPATHEE